MPATGTTSWSPFPPRTREVQFDEKWAFVAKKEAHCDPTDPADARKGDHWDHVAFDPEHRLVVCVVPGKRTAETTGALVREFHRRTSGRIMGRVAKVEQRIIFGTAAAVGTALARSASSRAVNTSFVERQNGTDRNRNARKVRKSYCFSKDWSVHQAITFFTMYSYNFCWPVRTLR